MKIKKSSISKNLEVLCTLIACVMSPCFNYRLTTPLHTADKPPDLTLWNLIPFFKKSLLSSCTDAGCIGRDETAVCNISQACCIGFRSGDLAGHSIRTIVACSRYYRWCGLYVHAHCHPSEWNFHQQHLHMGERKHPRSRLRTWEPSTCRCQWRGGPFSPEHLFPPKPWLTPAKPIMFCHTNWSKTLIWHSPYPSTSIC